MMIDFKLINNNDKNLEYIVSIGDDSYSFIVDKGTSNIIFDNRKEVPGKIIFGVNKSLKSLLSGVERFYIAMG